MMPLFLNCRGKASLKWEGKIPLELQVPPIRDVFLRVAPSAHQGAKRGAAA